MKNQHALFPCSFNSTIHRVSVSGSSLRTGTGVVVSLGQSLSSSPSWDTNIKSVSCFHHLSWFWVPQGFGCMGPADSEEQNIPASQRLSNNRYAQPDSRSWRPLQLAPSSPRTTRGLLRQKQSVLIPQVQRELENPSVSPRLPPRGALY